MRRKKIRAFKGGKKDRQENFKGDESAIKKK